MFFFIEFFWVFFLAFFGRKEKIIGTSDLE